MSAEPEDIVRAIADELAEPKYRLGTPWWTRLVDALERAWIRFLEWAAAISELVGGPLVLALLVGGALVAAAVLITANLGRRRARQVEARIRREHEAVRGLDPQVLERQAREAEATGDLELAFRLLFQVALIRLDRAGAIDLRPATTSGGIAAALASPAFTRLAERFDAVAYGGRTATPDDPNTARSVLDSLLEGAPN